MGKKLRELCEIFEKFWADNIKTNYKRISFAIGTFLSVFTGQLIAAGMIAAPPWVVVILTAFDTLLTFLIISVFGKATNGNGHNVPSDKEIGILLKNDKEAREYIKERMKEKIKTSDKLNKPDDC